MALTTSFITGRVPLPTDENLQYAELTFALSGLDTEGADVLPGGISKRIILVESDIPSGFDLWQNTAGLRGTHYRVLARWTVKDRDGVRDQYADLGIIQIGSSASYTLASLLNTAVPAAIGTFWTVLTQAEYDAAIDAVALAQAWAESPTAPGVPGTKSAKTWAEEAEASAAVLAGFATGDPFNGVTTAGVTDYALPYNPISASFVQLYVGGVRQEPGVGFTLIPMASPSGFGFRLTFSVTDGLDYWGYVQRPLAADPNATVLTPEQFMGVGITDAQAISAAMQASVNSGTPMVARGSYILDAQVSVNFTNHLIFDTTGAVFTAGVGFPGGGTKMFSVSGGTGSNLTFDWVGGHFDGRNMPKEGDLSSNDCIHIATADSASVVRFHPESIIMGDDWRDAGGDAAVFAVGNRLDINLGYCRGALDLGVYVSASSTSGPKRYTFAKIRGTFENCTRAASAKRGFNLVDVDIAARNCQTGWTSAPAEVDGITPDISVLGGNVTVRADRCQWPIVDVRGSGVKYNVTAYRMGAYLPETSPGAGDAFVSTASRCRFQGTQHATGFLSVHAVNPDVVAALGGAYVAGSYGAVEFSQHVGISDTKQCLYNMLLVHTTDLGRVVYEKDASDFNCVEYYGNYYTSIVIGANSFVNRKRSYADLGAIGFSNASGENLTLTGMSSLEANNNAGAAQNILQFKDLDGSSLFGQSVGRMSWAISDFDAPGVGAFIEARTGSSTGNVELILGTGVGGAASDRVKVTTSGGIEILSAGKGIKFTSPDGLTSKTLTIANTTGAAVWT